MNRVAIVDTGLCNLDSIARAIEECGGTPIVTDDPVGLTDVARIILPGVGAFPEAMARLRKRGLVEAMTEQVLGRRIPFLGVCLGMQLMASRGTEVRETPGLGWIEGEVRLLEPGKEERIPHIGWNEVQPIADDPLFLGIAPGHDFYFVHSYVLRPEHVEDVAATTDYGGGFVSAVHRGNVFGASSIPRRANAQASLSSATSLLCRGRFMLKVRIMPTLLYKDVVLVKGLCFDSWRRVGSAMQAVKVYNLRQVDELVLVDIRATLDGRGPDLAVVDELADECFMPLTVGGGVRTIEDVRSLLMVGADKVSMNTAAIETPELIRDVSERFGAQCAVVSIDARRESNGTYEVYTHAGTCRTGRDPVEVAQVSERMGAGEFLLTSIDRDGTMEGYDIELTRRVVAAVHVPVIASGGAGSYEHMAEVLRETNASAVAAASMFHFTEQTPLEAKRYLGDRGFAVRR